MFRRKKSFLLMVMVVLITIASLSLFAIASETQAKEEYWIVFAVKNMVNPFWKACWVGAQRAAKEYDGVKITYTSPTSSDNIAEQTRQMEDIIGRHPDAIVFCPVDYTALVPTIEKANRAGIPIFNYCNVMGGGKIHTYVGLDDIRLAYNLAKYAFEKVPKDPKIMPEGDTVIDVIVQDGVPGASTAQDRHEGYMKAIEETPNVNLLTCQPANYNRLKGMEVMENLLQRYSEIDVVLAANDEQALGCIEAIDAAGRLSKIFVTGCDANYDAVESIAAGRLNATANYSGLFQGYMATKAAIEWLRGASVPQYVIVPAEIIDKNNTKPLLIPFEDRPLPDYNKVVASVQEKGVKMIREPFEAKGPKALPH